MWMLNKKLAPYSLSPRPNPETVAKKCTHSSPCAKEASLGCRDRLPCSRVYSPSTEQERITKWTLNSWNSSLSPQSVTLAPRVSIAHSNRNLWVTDVIHLIWIAFTCFCAIPRIPLISFGDLEWGWVSLMHFILLSWFTLTSPLSLPTLPSPPAFPYVISITFSFLENQ